MTSSSKYASAADKYLSPAAAKDHVVAFSISYQRDNMLARGMGLEHLNELLLRLGQVHFAPEGPVSPMAATGRIPRTTSCSRCSAWSAPSSRTRAYAAVADGNPEQSDFDRDVRLYNHLPWPLLHGHHAGTPRRSGSIAAASSALPSNVREFRKRRWCPMPAPIRRIPEPFNKAITLSAMRRLMMQPMSIDIPGVEKPKRIPPVTARILLGGKVDGYSRFSSRHFRGSVGDAGSRNARSTSSAALAAQRKFWPGAMLARGNDPAPRSRRSTGTGNGTRRWRRCSTAPGSSRCRPVSSTSRNHSKRCPNSSSGPAKICSDTLRTGLERRRRTRELLKTGNIANAVHLVRADWKPARTCHLGGGEAAP